MALPLLSWGAKSISSGTNEIQFRDKEELEAYLQCIHKDKLEAQAAISKLEMKLGRLQDTLENLRGKFTSIVNSIEKSGDSPEDKSFMKSIVNMFKGYTTSQVFALIALGHVRYHVLDLHTDKEVSNLTNKVLEFAQSGFPPKLRADLKTIWEISNEDEIENILDKYSKELPREFSLPLQKVLAEIDSVVHELDDLSDRKELMELEIKGNEKFLVEEEAEEQTG